MLSWMTVFGTKIRMQSNLKSMSNLRSTEQVSCGKRERTVYEEQCIRSGEHST